MGGNKISEKVKQELEFYESIIAIRKATYPKLKFGVKHEELIRILEEQCIIEQKTWKLSAAVEKIAKVSKKDGFKILRSLKRQRCTPRALIDRFSLVILGALEVRWLVKTEVINAVRGYLEKEEIKKELREAIRAIKQKPTKKEIEKYLDNLARILIMMKLVQIGLKTDLLKLANKKCLIYKICLSQRRRK